MTSNKFAHTFSLLLLLLTIVTCLASWCVSLCGGPLCNILDGAGLRWLFTHAIQDTNSFVLLTALLIIIALGALKESKIVEEMLVINQRSLAVVMLVDVFVFAMVLYWSFAPESPLIGATGRLFPSPLARGILPFVCIIVSFEATLYALLVRRIAGLSDVFPFVTRSLNHYLPWYVTVVLATVYYNIFQYVVYGI